MPKLNTNDAHKCSMHKCYEQAWEALQEQEEIMSSDNVKLTVQDWNESFAAQVWHTLSRIDVGDHIESKGDRVKLSYLSWSWAWAQLMNHYPQSEFRQLPPERHDDGTVTVCMTVTVAEGDNRLERLMWLPVMDHTNKAITNPNARHLSDSTMRCLVKCLALFGLGLDLYAKSDIPVGSWDDPLTPDQAVLLAGLFNQLPENRQSAFLVWQDVESISEIPQSKYKDARARLESVIKSKDS